MTSAQAQLLATATALGVLRDDCVFVGGAILCVYVGHTPPPRATKDVDIVVSVHSTVDYELDVARPLRDLGWTEDTSEGAPRCRFIHPVAGVLDAMPLSDADFGFSNRWYPEVVRSACSVSIGGLELRVASLPGFLATKVEAFLGRGESDWRSSHDLEDILTLLSTGEDVVALVDVAERTLRAFLRDTFAEWLTPVPTLLTIDGQYLTIDGKRLSLGDEPAPIEQSARGHFPGNAAGERAATVAIERMRLISSLAVR